MQPACEFSEEKLKNKTQPFYDFCMIADLLILDAQYATNEDLLEIKGVITAESMPSALTNKSNINHLVLLTSNQRVLDQKINSLFKNTLEYKDKLLENLQPENYFLHKLSITLQIEL